MQIVKIIFVLMVAGCMSSCTTTTTTRAETVESIQSQPAATYPTPIRSNADINSRQNVEPLKIVLITYSLK